MGAMLGHCSASWLNLIRANQYSFVFDGPVQSGDLPDGVEIQNIHVSRPAINLGYLGIPTLISRPVSRWSGDVLQGI